jgi:hypothetical protein
VGGEHHNHKRGNKKIINERSRHLYCSDLFDKLVNIKAVLLYKWNDFAVSKRDTESASENVEQFHCVDERNRLTKSEHWQDTKSCLSKFRKDNQSVKNDDQNGKLCCQRVYFERIFVDRTDRTDRVDRTDSSGRSTYFAQPE